MERLGIHVHYLLFKILKTLYLVINWVTNNVLGFHLVNGSKLDLSKSRINNSGNLTRILVRGCPAPQYPRNQAWNLKHFILKHDKYVNPEEYVLRNDCVTLMGMDENLIWFSISSKQDVYDLTKFPFVFLSQYWFAEKILILDHSTFNRISEKCSGPTENCILINHTGRCGSTLLNQVLS